MKNKNKEKNVTVLGKETAFNGVMKFTDVLHIEGSFIGDIDATGFLYVAKGAVCEVGHINVSSIVVEGTVHGAINATGDVELKQHATVIGDIVALRLKIADDVSFHGEIHMLNGVPSVADDIFAMDVSNFRKTLKESQENTMKATLEKTDLPPSQDVLYEQNRKSAEDSPASQEKAILLEREEDADSSEW